MDMQRYEAYILLPPLEMDNGEHKIPRDAFFRLVSVIPYGKICTTDEIENVLKSSYNIKSVVYKNDINTVFLYVNNAFPYWRVVSKSGYLIDSSLLSLDRHKAMLENESVAVLPPNKNGGFRVENYKKYLFSFNNCKITVLKTPGQIKAEAEQVLGK